MSPEEFDRKIEFIVSSQAQFAADLQRLAERQEAFQAELEVFKETASTALEIATRAAESVYSAGGGMTRVMMVLVLLALPYQSGYGQSPHRRVEFATILETRDSRISAPSDRVILNQEAWVQFWAEVHAGADPLPPLPEVDFSQRMIIAAALGSHPLTAGQAISVTKLVLTGPEMAPVLKVYIEERRVGPQCFGLGEPTSPVHMIETDLHRQVTFRRSTMWRLCGGR